ncbi:MAG TPA: chloride channel protein [Flavobacteriales bacterium]|nr:chloride channel protein [Flavobacteriales bacterium]HIA10718.1 chloride channel protein [Flavobacteriales bacterium]HIO71838.1 chloride channel protein [Flavobacteriales bacterium]
MRRPSILGRFFIWKVKNTDHKYFLLVLSVIIGLLSGLAAVTLKTTVHYIGVFFTKSKVFDIQEENYYYLAYPLIGILITVWYVRTFIKQDIGHGISRILYAISKKSAIMKSHNMYSSIISCTFTGGFGGSVGMEAPIVSTGAAIGSNIGQLFRMNYKATALLVACGATGAMAGIFNAPIAALIFSLEVLMLDLTLTSIIPLLMASVTGALMANLLLGDQIMFYFTLKDAFNIYHLPYYIALGVIAGIISVYFTRVNMSVEAHLEKILNPYKRLLIGGVILGMLIFIFPPLYGEGYIAMKAILSGTADSLLNNSLFYSMRDNSWFLILFLVFVLLFKVIATAITTGTGGIGGIFAPTLFMGGITGFVFAKVLNSFNFVTVSESNFALVGMAGLIAGVIHAPLTAIFLIAEITNGYDLFIPLMVTSAISYLTIMFFEPHSIYTKRLAKRGELLTHHKDKAVLSQLRLETLIEKDATTIKEDATLGDLVKVIANSKRNIIAVLDENQMLLGIVPLDSIRKIMFNQEMYDVTEVGSLMVLPPTYVYSTEPMEEVLKKFEDSGEWSLPVIDDGQYKGFVLKNRLFSAYRQKMIEFSED